MLAWALYDWVIREMVLEVEVTGLLLEVVRGEVWVVQSCKTKETQIL